MAYKYLLTRDGSDPEAVYDTEEDAERDRERKNDPAAWMVMRVRDRI